MQESYEKKSALSMSFYFFVNVICMKFQCLLLYKMGLCSVIQTTMVIDLFIFLIFKLSQFVEGALGGRSARP